MNQYAYDSFKLDQLEAALSATRLDKYMRFALARDPSTVTPREDALGYYAWNLKIGAALLGPLQVLEITLRNSCHVVLSTKFGPNWPDDPAFVEVITRVHWPLPPANFSSPKRGPNLINKIYDTRMRVRDDMIKKLKKLNKAKSPAPAALTPPTVGTADLIAGMEFGFWTTLLSGHFEVSLWRDPLLHAFPQYKAVTGRSTITRAPIAERFTGLRILRNRLMHHEPLLNRNLARDYAEILDTISWMRGDVADWVDHHSQFASVLASLSDPPQTFSF